MFRKCLLVSVVLHIALIVGAGLSSSLTASNVTPPQFQLVSAVLPGAVGQGAQSGGAGVMETNQLGPDKPERPAGRKNRVIKVQQADELLTSYTPASNSEVNTQDAVPTGQLPAGEQSGKDQTGAVAGGEVIESSGITALPGGDSLAGGNGKSGTGNGAGSGDGAEVSPNYTLQTPVKTHHAEPFYPAAARQNKWEGTVVLEAALDKNGRIGKITLIQSSGHQLLDDEARKAVKKWRYQPATKDGKPIEWYVRVKIIFKLEE